MIKEAMLYKKAQDFKVECFLCAHNCKIANKKFGLCGVRQNKDGKLYTHVYGEVIASHTDPIEKKPLYHFLPGSAAYSIATIGCNFKCGFCQNWQISQLKAGGNTNGGYELKPEDVVREAKKFKAKSISYTYTEPTVFFEYAYDTARLAKEQNIYNSFVTNGFMTQEALKTILPFLDAANVDLKFFNDDSYKKICQGRLQPVLDSIKFMKDSGIWVEITTLIVPGLNDSEDELRKITEFIASVSKDIPWHISRFHPDYKYTDFSATDITTMHKAKRIAEDSGLRYVYLGNIDEDSDTVCYSCGAMLVKRSGYFIQKNQLKDGKCARCGAEIEGKWQ